MTVASEITRLQGAKSDIRQAIIDKGVDVGAGLTLDEYAACICDIQQGASVNFLNILIVGGGGGGGSRSGTAGGGGGGGQVRCLEKIGTEKSSFCVVIGLGGGGNQNGGNSCICSSDGCLAYAVGGGHDTDTRVGGRSGSGCTGGGHSCAGGGGGGANGNGCNGYGQGYAGNGGDGLYGYGGGGGGNGYFNNGTGKDGGGNGDQNANGYGGGGGGNSKSGYQGMAEICYPTDGSYGFTTATGGNCCYTCNGYKVHRFTSNGTFTIVS